MLAILGDSGILQVVRRSGREAGIGKLYPHLFRHTYAHEMLSAGMQEGDLLMLGGWRDRGDAQPLRCERGRRASSGRLQAPLVRGPAALTADQLRRRAGVGAPDRC
jgi:integrase